MVRVDCSLVICLLILFLAPRVVMSQTHAVAPAQSENSPLLQCTPSYGDAAHSNRSPERFKRKSSLCSCTPTLTSKLRSLNKNTLDSQCAHLDADSSDLAVSKEGSDAGSAEAFSRSIMNSDLTEEGSEALKLRPEVFLQGRYSFHPVGENSDARSNFDLTQLEVGWSGRVSRRIGVGFEMQMHAVINGEPRNVINDAFIEYDPSEHVSIKAGQVIKPFGFDTQQSTTVRESPERAMFVGYFFPEEHDRGIVLSGDLNFVGSRAFQGVSYSFGVFSGNLFLSRESSEVNYAARLRKTFARGKFALGVSMQRGTQHLPEGLVGTTRKNLYGADFQYTVGRFGLRGEFAGGHTPSSLIPEELISDFRPDAHAAGGTFTTIYRLTHTSSLYARYDQFNGDPAVGQPIRAFNLGYMRRVGKFSRVDFDYQLKNRRSFNESAVNDRLQITWSTAF